MPFDEYLKYFIITSICYEHGVLQSSHSFATQTHDFTKVHPNEEFVHDRAQKHMVFYRLDTSEEMDLTNEDCTIIVKQLGETRRLFRHADPAKQFRASSFNLYICTKKTLRKSVVNHGSPQ
jgi:hypothetical protein